jgi:hypothetical protein
MTDQYPTSRTIARLLATALVIAATAAVAASLTTPAAASEGLTPTRLANAGWTCFQAPVGPPSVVCANPGVGRPFPGNPDPPPHYTLVRFDPDGNYDAKVHLIRADLYAGQPCGPSGDPYVFSPRIGYYECVRANGA